MKSHGKIQASAGVEDDDEVLNASVNPRLNASQGSQNQPQGPGGCASEGTYDSVRGFTLGLSSLVPSVGSSSRGRFVPATHFGGDEAATLGLTKVLSDEADEGGGRGAGLIMGERSLGDVGGTPFASGMGSSGGGFLRKRTIGTYPYSVEQNTHREEQTAL